MDKQRQQLHRLVDELPDEALQRAEHALKYCANPMERQFTIDQVKRRAKERMQKSLEDYAKRMGHGMLSNVGSSVAMTAPTGDFRFSMAGWDNGPVTYQLRSFTGHIFEIYERLELAPDATKLVLTQRIVAPNGSEQVVTAEMPVDGRKPDKQS